MNRWIPGVGLMVLLAFSAGCARIGSGGGSAEAAPSGPTRLEVADPQALAVDVAALRLRLRDRLELANQRIEGMELPSERRRSFLDWQGRVQNRLDQSFADDYAENILVGVWLFSLRLQHYLESGAPGAGRFGAAQPVVNEAVERMVEDAERVARRHLTPEGFATARAEIDALARANPIRGALAEDTLSMIGSDLRSSLGFLASVPLIPLRTVEGITRGAGGITDLPTAVLETARVMESLPRETREQAELLYFNIEDSDMATTVVMSLERFTAASDRMSFVAEELPDLIRGLPDEVATALIRVMEDSVTAQEELRETLREARLTLQAGEETAATATELLNALAEASRSLEATVNAATRLVEAVVPAESSPRDPDAPRFDINDYTRMLIELTRASGDLRETLLTVESIAASDELIDRRASAVRQEGDLFIETQFERANELMDRLFGRLVMLVFLLFGLAVSWVFIKRAVMRGGVK